MRTLKPCPFCNSTDVSVNRSEITCMSWVSCTSCGLETPSETGVTDEQAISYWNTRPAAPVEGLETKGYMRPEDRGQLSFWVSKNQNAYYREPVVARPQAEAIIAAERAKGEKFEKMWLDVEVENTKLKTDNEALTARFGELEKINADLCRSHGVLNVTGAKLDEQVKALETQLAATKKALEEIAALSAIDMTLGDQLFAVTSARAALRVIP